jgi:hypothetical protein
LCNFCSFGETNQKRQKALIYKGYAMITPKTEAKPPENRLAFMITVAKIGFKGNSL